MLWGWLGIAYHWCEHPSDPHSGHSVHHRLDRALACQSHWGIEKTRDNGDGYRDDGVVPVRKPHLAMSSQCQRITHHNTSSWTNLTNPGCRLTNNFSSTLITVAINSQITERQKMAIWINVEHSWLKIAAWSLEIDMELGGGISAMFETFRPVSSLTPRSHWCRKFNIYCTNGVRQL